MIFVRIPSSLDSRLYRVIKITMQYRYGSTLDSMRWLLLLLERCSHSPSPTTRWWDESMEFYTGKTAKLLTLILEHGYRYEDEISVEKEGHDRIFWTDEKIVSHIHKTETEYT